MTSADSKPGPAQRCDLAILTVIEIEHRQVLKAFGLTEQKRRIVNHRSYWETTLYSKNTQRQLRLVIGNVSRAGLVPAALRTLRFLDDYEPTMLVLVGIAAGCRENVRIGGIVWPRNVLNISQIEEHTQGKKFRPDHHKPCGEVSDMMQTWAADEAELAALTVRILGEPFVVDPNWKDTFGDEVIVPPKVQECVIACADTLVRNAKVFSRLKKLDPQVKAFEMESAGMVLAIEDSGRRTAWLQIRGISDFGDHKKHDSWQPYAAAAAAAYVRLFAESGFNPELITGMQPQLDEALVVSPTASALPSSASLAMSAHASERALPAHPVAHEFDELRQRWRVHRDVDVIQKLRGLCETMGSQQTPPAVQARILRFTARLTLDVEKNENAAVLLAKKADALGEPSRVMQALFAAKESPLSGANVLEAPTTLEEWNQRMLFLLQANQIDKVLEQWNAPPEGVGPDVESYRLRTLALISKKRLSEARTVFGTIPTKHKDLFAVRFVGPILDYFEAISTAAPDGAFQIAPVAISPDFIKRDKSSLKALDHAETGFKTLLDGTPTRGDVYFELQHWRLVALVSQPLRRIEAEELCTQLLIENPGDPQVMAIAAVHSLPVEQDSNIAALAAKLNVQI
jgi:nucleoside phosphorylase